LNNDSSSEPVGNGKMSVWAGNEKRWINLTDELKNIGSDLKLLALIDLFRLSLWTNYFLRDSFKGFETLSPATFEQYEDFLSFGSLDLFSSVSTVELLNRFQVNPRFANHLILPLTRTIYDQDLNINGFAGIVSLLPTLTPGFSVKSGNSDLVSAMFRFSNATVHLNTKINTITKFQQQQQQQQQLDESTNNYFLNDDPTDMYSFIVVASPIEFTDIDFVNIKLEPYHRRLFMKWIVTHIVAKGINPSFFGEEEGFEVPDTVLTTNDSTLPFTIISIRDKTIDGTFNIYKIFSNNPVSDFLDKLFLDLQTFQVQEWPYTFPDLKPPPSPTTTASRYQPINLFDNSIYYLNGIESLASAMESSIISGRNIATLIAKQFS